MKLYKLAAAALPAALVILLWAPAGQKVEAGTCPALPQDESISGVRLCVPQISQLPELPNGCEVTSAAMLLQYYGFAADKLTLAAQYLPVAAPVTEADPETTYMGDPFSDGWYCFAPPLVQAVNGWLQDNGGTDFTALDITGTPAEDLTAYLDGGDPVLVWGTLDFAQLPRRSQAVTLANGEAPYVNLHCLVLCGYDDAWYYFTDPLDCITRVDIRQFTLVYQAMGCRAMVLQKMSPAE